MDPNTRDFYDYVWGQVKSCNNISIETESFLAILMDESYQQNRYNKPMFWIGMYIGLASLFCILAMMADLVHAFRNTKLWFPCRYFTLNAVSLSVIAVAMKLLVDLNNSMRGHVDQMAKLGSMSFMCVMMANLLPSLATMNNKEIVTNIIALGVLVITLVVNVCIQINTGVFCSNFEDYYCYGLVVYDSNISKYLFANRNSLIAIMYVGMLLMLMIIHICSALAIPNYKRILESKYQAAHENALKHLELQQPGRLSTVEKIKKQVSYYWIMSGTGSPQFISACSATTSAAGVICGSSCLIHVMMIVFTLRGLWDFDSDYKWSSPGILIIQLFGVILGTVAPLSRCFATLSFKVSIQMIWNYHKVFRIERYWTHKLYDWKFSATSFSFRSRKCKVVIENLKIMTLIVCIRVQKAVVVVCKMITLIPVLFVIYVLYCIRFFKWLKAMFSTSDIVLVKNTDELERNIDLCPYILQLQDEMELAERTLKGLLRSMNRLIEKSEKQQPKYLMKLLAESRGFEGVGKFDNHHVISLLREEHLNCWSLPLVTLTTIAISLPNIQNHIVDIMVSGVSEGLVYVKSVEESLNATDEYVSIHKAAQTLWLEVEVYHKWLGNKLKNHVLQLNTAGQILEWFRETAKNMVIEVEGMDIEGRTENLLWKSLCANSMYRITETILLSNQDNIDEVSQEELFLKLSSMISDILAACLTNLPQVITLRCQESAIEKREASVQAAVQLLGESMQLINILQDHELPSLNPDELPFIDKWRASLKHPSP